MNEVNKTIKLDGKRHYVTACAQLVCIHNRQLRSNMLLDIADAKELIEQLKICVNNAESQDDAA